MCFIYLSFFSIHVSFFLFPGKAVQLRDEACIKSSGKTTIKKRKKKRLAIPRDAEYEPGGF